MWLGRPTVTATGTQLTWLSFVFRNSSFCSWWFHNKTMAGHRDSLSSWPTLINSSHHISNNYKAYLRVCCYNIWKQLFINDGIISFLLQSHSKQNLLLNRIWFIFRIYLEDTIWSILLLFQQRECLIRVPRSYDSIRNLSTWWNLYYNKAF